MLHCSVPVRVGVGVGVLLVLLSRPMSSISHSVRVVVHISFAARFS